MENQTLIMNSTILNSNLSTDSGILLSTTENSTSPNSTTAIISNSSNSYLLSILSNPIFITFAVIVLILAVLSMIGSVFRHIREMKRRKLSSMEIQIWEAILSKASTINTTYDFEQLIVKQQYIVVPLQCTCEPQVDP